MRRTPQSMLFVVLLAACGGGPEVPPDAGPLRADAGPPSGVTVAIDPMMASLRTSASISFTASVTGASDTAVIWSVQEGDAGGSVADGVYTAPSNAGRFHLVATSRADPGARGVATITVSMQSTSLTPGVWTEITPAGAHRENWHSPSQTGGCTNGPDTICTYGVNGITVDPSNASVLYLPIDSGGLWRTEDGGVNWEMLGRREDAAYGSHTTALDVPLRVAVDPDDASHLYATQGVRGITMGFWVSHDRGATWDKPAGFVSFADAGHSHDVTMLAVDPHDFAHVLIAFHSDWDTTAAYSSGIAESRDGGATWTAHIPPSEPWGAGTKAVHFLVDPETGEGSSDAWLVVDEGSVWRTIDAGAHWEQVSMQGGVHGGTDLYFAHGGALYSGSYPTPLRSTDNGASWSQVPLGHSYFWTVWGDGEQLYARGFENSAEAYRVAPEASGEVWTLMTTSPVIPEGQPYSMRFDRVNRILYSANWAGGLWALRME